jgi:hypothetical protein
MVDPETGREGWHVDAIVLGDSSIVEYDDEFNILVVGRRASSSELLLMPGRYGAHMCAGYANTTISLPLWRDSAISFDKSGIQKIIYLGNKRASVIFSAIRADHAAIDKVFEVTELRDPARR